jgi:hypothetical protein
MPEPIYRVMLRGNASSIPTVETSQGPESSPPGNMLRTPGSESGPVDDTSADTTIDKQLHKELTEMNHRGDTNLLG